MKFYAVAVGHKVGIYDTWDECKAQVDGYQGAKYRKFNNKNDASNFINENSSIKFKDTINSKETTKPIENVCNENTVNHNGIYTNFIKREKDKFYFYVDGSYNSSKEIVGYGLALVKNDKVIIKDFQTFIDDPFNIYRNVYGEIKGAMKAIELAYCNDIKDIVIVYDYKGIECWANRSWKCNNKMSEQYVRMHNFYKDKINISFAKVKSHSNDVYNDLADKLAGEAAFDICY